MIDMGAMVCFDVSAYVGAGKPVPDVDFMHDIGTGRSRVYRLVRIDGMTGRYEDTGSDITTTAEMLSALEKGGVRRN